MRLVLKQGRLWGVLLCFIGLSACSQTESLTDKLTVGEPFPEIDLPRLDGAAPNSVSDYRGKLVVLNLWATWCEPCRREMPNLQQLSDRLDDQRFAVLGMAQDEDDHLVREYLIDTGVSFAEHIDAAGAISTEKLGVQLFPYTLLIAPDGQFIQRITGPREWQRDEVVELLEKAYSGDYAALR